MPDESIQEIKDRIQQEAKRLESRLIDISHTMHANPEIRFQEYKAAELLSGELEEHGFDVERGVAGLDTAFVATYGEGEPVVGIIAEYDALPKIGHACGHNLIGTWAVGAGIALRRALPDVKGTIKVIGSPAEEGGGGKVIQADAGIFDGLAAAMMIHPRDTTFLDRGSLAVARYEIEFFGKPAHAAGAPERGVNALDAMIQVFNSIAFMRQQVKNGTRIHGIITNGGDAANVIPEYTSGLILVRATSQEYLEELKTRFRNIVDAAALATGTTVKVSEGIGYKQRVCNTKLVDTFGENLTSLGYDYEVPGPDTGVGSSDIGDVSHLVPTIHPYLQVCEKGIGNHTQEFAEAAKAERANKTLADGATMLAWTAADVLLRPELREELVETFREQHGRDPQ